MIHPSEHPATTLEPMSMRLAELAAAIEAKDGALVSLRQERDSLRSEIEKRDAIIAHLKRAQYGRRSEKLDADQLQFGLEDEELAAARTDAAKSADEAAPTPDVKSSSAEPERRRKARGPRRNRGALPSNLARYEVVVDIDDKLCPCCGKPLHKIGEDVSEQLDIIPARLWIKVTRRPKYACRSCTDGVSQAPAPARPITGGMATEALLAHVIIGKYCDHLPLYRQAEIFSRQGIDLDRSTLADWVGRAAWWLAPLHQLLLATVSSSPKIFCDDTPVPVLDPGRGRTKTGRLWAYARDDRPWGGPLPPAVAYVYTEDRKAVRPANQLARFSGVLQVDGYAGFKRLSGERPNGTITLAYCWAHCRRKFYDAEQASGSEAAAEVLRRIAALYKVEEGVRGKPPDVRVAARQKHSKALVEDLKVFLERTLDRVSGKSILAEAIRYALGHWDGLIRFLDDGRLELDTNTVERTIRPIKLGAKNYLFAGSDAGGDTWAVIASLIQTAKLNGVEPLAYLTDVLERIVSGRVKVNELDVLLPWNWRGNKTDA